LIAHTLTLQELTIYVQFKIEIVKECSGHGNGQDFKLSFLLITITTHPQTAESNDTWPMLIVILSHSEFDWNSIVWVCTLASH
jgi:hypothetical protein